MSPDPALDRIPWGERPLLEIGRGRADPADLASVTPCFAGIAETGTLMLVSGGERPATLNFLPDNHIVVLQTKDVIGTYEEGFARLRQAANGADGGFMPRTVNFVTGPSRTADIELTLIMGAHGPRRLHVVLVDDEEA
jgi:L-lactate dehydrogenase complex protein LldG